MRSRRHPHLRGSTATPAAARPSQAQTAPIRRRSHYLLVPIQLPDRGRVLARILTLLPARSLVGLGRCWSPPERVRYADQDDADERPEAIAASIQALLDKIDTSASIDIIMVIGATQLIVPDGAVDLFNVLDSALNQPSCHAAVRMLCLQDTDLHDWDALLGAKVIRVTALSEIGASCFDDGNVVFRGGLQLTSCGPGPAARIVPGGIRLVVHDRARVADAARLFSGAAGATGSSPAQIKILSRVSIATVPVIMFRRSVRGLLQWNASPDAAHRLLSYWAGGNGIMSDGHGLFMEVIGGGPILFVYAAEGQLHFRTVISLDDESKMVAVKQALSHSERYACAIRYGVTGPSKLGSPGV